MSAEAKSPLLMIIDDDPQILALLERFAKADGIERLKVFSDSQSAIVDLNDTEELPTALLTDGLNGGFLDVIETADKVGVPVAVISGDPNNEKIAVDRGAIFRPKVELSHGAISAILNELLQLDRTN